MPPGSVREPVRLSHSLQMRMLVDEPSATSERFTIDLKQVFALNYSFQSRHCRCGGKTLGLLHNGNGDSGKNRDRKSTRLNSSHANISYAVFCLKKKKKTLTKKQSYIIK